MDKKKIIIIVFSFLLIIFSSSMGIIASKSFKIKENAVINPELIPISTETAGILRDIYVQPKQNVERGQLVAEIEIPKSSTQNIISYKPDLSSAKAKLKEAEENYKNFALMYKDGVISQEDYDNSLDKLTSAQTAYKNAVEKAKSIDVHNNKIQNDVIIKKVYAPRDGVVNANFINKGEQAQPSKPIMLLAVNTPKVTAFVNEDKVKKIKENQKVLIKVKTFKEKTFIGNVQAVSTTTYNVAGYKTPVYAVYIGFKDNVESYGFTPFQPVSVIFSK